VNRRPRIAFIASRFAPDLGGVARSASRTAQSLVAAGCDVDVFTLTRGVPPGQLVSLRSADEHGSLDGRLTVHRLGAFAHEDLTLQHAEMVLEWLADERAFDLVWGHYVDAAAFVAVLFAERRGLPSVVSARGNDIERLAYPPGDFARLRWTLERATRVLAVSAALAGKIRAIVDERVRGRVHETPNVVDSDVFLPGGPDPKRRARLGIPEGAVVLGFSGELRHKKGLPFLVRALAEVRATRPAHLLVIGEVRPREHEALSVALEADRSLRDAIAITGHLEDPHEVAAHLRLCDLVLVPSLWDGMPNALLEAMACARVVLTSDAGGMPEVVKHGETGFIVRRAELHRLGEAAIELLDLDAAARDRIGMAARAHVAGAHAPDREIASLQGLLESLGLRAGMA